MMEVRIQARDFTQLSISVHVDHVCFFSKEELIIDGTGVSFFVFPLSLDMVG